MQETNLNAVTIEDVIRTLKYKRTETQIIMIKKRIDRVLDEYILALNKGHELKKIRCELKLEFLRQDLLRCEG